MKVAEIHPQFELGLVRKLLIGRSNGETLTKTLKANGKSWEKLESEFDRIDIHIEQIAGMNKSFFLGAFGQRVSQLGIAGFSQKYNFIGDPLIVSDIQKDFIPAALLDFPRG